MQSNVHTFYVDAVLFDMDGTLTDSIAAVEAAWGKVAEDIGQDRAYVIAATHGKRAVDNLSQFKPSIKPHEMDAEVQKFEESILFFADAHRLYGPGCAGSGNVCSAATVLCPDSDARSAAASASQPDSAVQSPLSVSTPLSPVSSGEATPDLVSPSNSLPSSRASSFAALGSRRPSFASRLTGMLSMTALAGAPQQQHTASIYDASARYVDGSIVEEDEGVLTFDTDPKKQVQQEQLQRDLLEAWQIEAASVDRCVRILPGVRRMIDSIPTGRYAVATSGAKTYAYGCMTRVGIVPPKVTITADDKRLKAGKPAPDPFLLAARELGFEASKCVVFEDSPSGIRAGIASGATVIAVCTSHERKKIEHIGAHFVVDNMESVTCEPCADGRLKFTVRL